MAGKKPFVSIDERVNHVLNTRRPVLQSRSNTKTGHDLDSTNAPFVLDDIPEAPYSSELQSALDHLVKVRRYPFIRRLADSLYVVGSGAFSVDGGTNSIGWKLLPYRRMRDIPENILLDHASMREDSGTVAVHLLRAAPGSTIAMWVHRKAGNVNQDIPGKKWRLILDDTNRGWHPDQMLFEMASKTGSVLP